MKCNKDRTLIQVERLLYKKNSDNYIMISVLQHFLRVNQNVLEKLIILK